MSLQSDDAKAICDRLLELARPCVTAGLAVTVDNRAVPHFRTNDGFNDVVCELRARHLPDGIPHSISAHDIVGDFGCRLEIRPGKWAENR